MYLEDVQKFLTEIGVFDVDRTPAQEHILSQQIMQFARDIEAYADSMYDSGHYDAENDSYWDIDSAREEGYDDGYNDARAEFEKND